MINVACVFKVLQAALRVWLAGKFYVTRLFIKRTVFLSRSFRCGSHTFEATKQQKVRDAQMGLHNCDTFRNITLTNSNKFIHIVTRRHNKPYVMIQVSILVQPHRTVVANFVQGNFGLFRRNPWQPLAEHKGSVEPRLKNTALML